MTVFCAGSVNVDHVYALPHMLAPGETLTARSLTQGLGGKGANQSVASARAGAQVRHIGAVGRDTGGAFALEALRGFGVDVTGIAEVDAATGHAVILLSEADAENAIVVHPGANHALDLTTVTAALSGGPGDVLLLQNETTLQAEIAQAAKAQGMRVIYSCAPFDVSAVRAMLPHVDLLAMNAGEAAALTEALGQPLSDLPPAIVTDGADGATFHHGAATHHVPAPQVTPVDTTGAGDTFIGYVAAGLDAGEDIPSAMARAVVASALQVTRPGAAQAIPSADEVAAFKC